MDRNARIFIAGGHRGLVGSAIVRNLQARDYTNLLMPPRSEVDLQVQAEVNMFFEREKPEYVFLAAGRVGGIQANDSRPADFILDNLQIECNIIDAAHKSGTKKLLFLGSSCIYPKLAPQPMREDALLTGALEPTNEWYAVAKIAGIKLCQAFRRQHGFNAISLMPTNLYGPGDNFDLNSSHVLPALMRKFHDAKLLGAPNVTVWGSGTPRREFLHVDDLADACIYLMQNYDSEEIVNIGCGEDISISELAELVRSVVGYRGQIVYDTSKPDGTPRKLMDVSRITALGWQRKIKFQDGLSAVYRWFLESSGDTNLRL